MNFMASISLTTLVLGFLFFIQNSDGLNKHSIQVSYEYNNSTLVDTSAMIFIYNNEDILIAKGKTDSLGEVNLMPLVHGEYNIYVISPSVQQDVYELSKELKHKDYNSFRFIREVFSERTKILNKGRSSNIIEELYDLDNIALERARKFSDSLPKEVKNIYNISHISNNSLKYVKYIVSSQTKDTHINMGKDSEVDLY